MKDRMARAAVEGAEKSGRLAPGGTVVEYTGGTTGISLAFVCAAKGYRSEIVFSDAFRREKALTMMALGANVTIVQSEQKGITERTIAQMHRRHWHRLHSPSVAAGQADAQVLRERRRGGMGNGKFES
jgi:cysteine synthase A